MKKPDWKLWIKDKTECKLWLDNYIQKQILRKSLDDSKLHLKRTDHNLTFANWIIGICQSSRKDGTNYLEEHQQRSKASSRLLPSRCQD